MAARRETAHSLPAAGYFREEWTMFVRAVWRIRRLVDIKQTLREMDVPSTRQADMLGVSGPDFSRMTRALFDR
ncbi:MAG: hypothetical protein ABS76_32255 [Pelagibacterium sp. SCN 64-44]|nr:MAG: hypothetical protein ABS76_32255 [Pelagibacterium sp. SCN 64-44]